MDNPAEKSANDNISTKEFLLHPVGVIRNRIEEPFLVAGREGIRMQGGLDGNMARIRAAEEHHSEIIINEDLVGLLDGIDDYSHIMVMYWAHKVPEESRSLIRVHPMGREEIPEVGIFSTCSPARPNPVLLTVVRLCARWGNVLEVSGLDAVDNSPVIDLKPFVPNHFPREDVRIPAWMQRIHDEVENRAS